MVDYRSQVLDRAVRILDTLAGQDNEVGLSELTSRLGFSKSTVHRLLMALAGHRFVRQNPQNGKFRLGERLFELGARVGGRARLIEAVREPLGELAAATGETAHLGILSQGEVVSVYAVEGPRTLRTPATVGRRTPAHASSLGKSMLAYLPADAVDEIIRARGLRRYTNHTLEDWRGLRAELEQIRRKGWAVDNEEFEEGLCCIGAPVCDGTGRVLAAISIAGPANRIRGQREGELIAQVKQAAARTSAALAGSATEAKRGTAP